MLKELAIHNFALIDKLNVSFTKGLNALTGETGAGKSILIDALNAVCGGKVGSQTLRAGADKALVEAVFQQTPEVSGWLKQQQLQNEDGDDLILSREITKSSSRSRINGTLVNSSIVAELRQKLLSIHTQHEARTLLLPQTQLEMLDWLGDDRHTKLQEQVSSLYARKRELTAQLNELKISEEERLRMLDFARFQLKELEEAELAYPEEDEKVLQECRILENVVELESTMQAAQCALSGGQEEGASSAIDLVQNAILQVEQASQIDTSLSEILEGLRASLETIEQNARELRRHCERLDADPESLSNLQARLTILSSVKRKYGPTLKDAIARREELSVQVAQLDNSQVVIEKIESELLDLTTQLDKVASLLSQTRNKLASKLSQEVQSTLSELGMERCQFKIDLTATEITANGLDRVEFLIAPNPGQPLLPIAKIASGGELSRVMLAIKSIFAEADRVTTVVFDEIDTGCSGRVLQTMRDKLAKLAASHQILCITHQPIIASVAENHLLVSKKQTVNSTSIQASILNKDERIKSLAEMASGHTDRQEALRFAQALLEEGTRCRG